MNELDKELLEACEKARDKLRLSEDAVSEARQSFETAVRRLYVDGASTREIAEALNLSHQRVHQLIGAAPKSWWQRILGVKAEPARDCSFCGREGRRVNKLVAGPSVNICDRCIETARVVLAGDVRSAKAPFSRLDTNARQRCSFCGSRKSGLSRATAARHQICSRCLEMAEKIVGAVK